jgi:hypothetical protein
MILSVIASLLSFAALGRLFIGLFIFAIFWRVSLLSLKNFSILSLSLMIRSVITVRRSELSPRRFSVMAEEADP